jgi:hydrogenase maturation protease
MYAKKQSLISPCRHSAQDEPTGLCIITVGNSLHGDDGISSSLCDRLPARVFEDACRFDLGPQTISLSDCLRGHRAAIIIDSTCDGIAAGSVSIVDLSGMLDQPHLNLNSTHGCSAIEELKLAMQQKELPDRIIFFGIGIGEVNWKEKLSPHMEKKLPQLVNNLAFLVEKILETLKKHA